MGGVPNDRPASAVSDCLGRGVSRDVAQFELDPGLVGFAMGDPSSNRWFLLVADGDAVARLRVEPQASSDPTGLRSGGRCEDDGPMPGVERGQLAEAVVHRPCSEAHDDESRWNGFVGERQRVSGSPVGLSAAIGHELFELFDREADASADADR